MWGATMPQTSEDSKTKTNSMGIKVLLITIVMSISVLTGCVSGCIYYNQTAEPTPEWRNLGSPPEPIVELVDAEFFTIYARGESGQLYSYYWESPYAYDGWSKVDEVDLDYESFCGDDNFVPSSDLLSSPFGASIESIYVPFCSGWAGRPSLFQAAYHLLESGEVAQQWNGNPFFFTAGYFEKFLLNGFIGLVAGFVTGILLSIKIWRSKRF